MENLRTHSLIEGQYNLVFRKSVTVCIKLTKAKAKGNVAACNCGSSAIVHPTCHVYPCPCPYSCHALPFRQSMQAQSGESNLIEQQFSDDSRHHRDIVRRTHAARTDGKGCVCEIPAKPSKWQVLQKRCKLPFFTCSWKPGLVRRSI